jgi:hypothetical protein
MASSKRNRSVTLAKSPLRSPNKPITKRPRQKTPQSSVTLPLPLRPTKPTSISTPTAFNSSQVSQSESEEENTIAQVVSESESKKESESEEEDDITCINKYLNQDLEELGLDRLDREDINESDAKIKVSKEFKNSKFFDQSVIDLKGKLSFKLPFREAVIGSSSSTYYLLVFLFNKYRY